MQSLARLTFLAATALAFSAALSTTGCAFSARAGEGGSGGGSGDVYCDQSGCYACDYTCAPVPTGADASAPAPDAGSPHADSGTTHPADAGSPVSSDASPAPDAGPLDAAPPPPDSAPPPDCVTTADCTSPLPQACVAGYCRYS